MSLMSNLYLGVTGLSASSNALNTTAHNMSNVDTDGYTRQQILQSTRTYVNINDQMKPEGKMQTGLGVQYAETRQVRDYFLDKSYRQETGRKEFYSEQAKATEQIEDILGESSAGVSFSQSLENLWVAVEELDKDPTSLTNQSLFITRCSEFVDNANGVYDSLKEYQQNLNTTVDNYVKTINQAAERIEELNIQIVKIEGGKVENANDLRDERNALLDELSTLASISYVEDGEGYVSVQLEGRDLVKGGSVNTIDIYTDPVTGFDTPFWSNLAAYSETSGVGGVVKSVIPSSVEDAELFDLDREIATEYNNDIGSLKGVLLARGDHAATFAEIDPNDANAMATYEDDIAQSAIMNAQAEFDMLIHNITSKINEIFSGYGDTKSANPVTIFTVMSTDSAKTTSVDGAVYPDEEDLTCGNIQLNQSLRATPSLISLRSAEGEEDKIVTTALKEAFEDEAYTLNPSITTKVSFNGYYNAMIGQVASAGDVFKSIESAQETTVNSLENARLQITGVNSDEELEFMVKFQNAYNASSRYINVVNAMLGTIIEQMQ
ncbi:MAG: flagellar hook-associated protein FlgK [Lachnospiraceae bacterium]|nr:flagellar hook-associated protein FlgK [Lachnospiraceae bacterium]